MKTTFKTLQLIAVCLVAILLAPLPASAVDESLQVVPEIWIKSGNETTPMNYSSRPDLPKPRQIAVYENDAVSDIGYVVASEFARSETAVFILFDSGKVIKFDFIARRVLWDVETSDDARQFAVSADGTKIVLTEKTGVLILHSNDGTVDKRLPDLCIGPCMAVAMSRDGRFVAVGDASGNAHVAEIGVPTNRWRRKNHDWPVRKLIMLENDGRRFLVTSDARDVVLYDLLDDEERRRMHGRHEQDGYRDLWINSLYAVPGTNFFVVGGYSDVFILDAAPGEIVGAFTESGQVVVSAYASADLKQVKAVSRDHIMYAWNTETGAVSSEHYLETPLLSIFTHSSISPDGSYTALTSTDLIFGLPPRAPNRIRIFHTP